MHTTRDTKFYDELKQLNEDLFKLIDITLKKSPYFDFTPTLKDYVKQFDELNQKYSKKSDQPTSFFSFLDRNSATNNESTNLFSKPVTTTTTSSGQFLFGNPTNLFSSSFTPNPFASNTNTTFSSATNFSPVSKIPSVTNEPKSEQDDEEDAPPPEPNVDKYEEPEAKYQVRCKLYERGKIADGTASINLIGFGVLFVKSMDKPDRLQVIFRQDPDLRKVALNEIITPQIPIKQVQKTVQLLVPGPNGETKFYFAKVKDEKDSNELFSTLKSIKQ